MALLISRLCHEPLHVLICGLDAMPDLQGIKKSKSKGKKKNPGPQDFKKQKVKVGRKVGGSRVLLLRGLHPLALARNLPLCKRRLSFPLRPFLYSASRSFEPCIRACGLATLGMPC